MAAGQKRKIRWAISLLLVMLYFSGLTAQAQYSGGSGDPNDPYQIATAEDLMLLGETPDDYDKHFILTVDVDLDPNLPGRKVFSKAVVAPDADQTNYQFDGTTFTGMFNGNAHTISHLTIDGVDYLGLFGRLHSRAKISNLGLVMLDINGAGRNVGGLVGYSDAVITNCYTTGTVAGNGNIGGSVGSNTGNITMSWSTGVVTGGNNVGGLVGSNSGGGSITASYSSGSVSGYDKVGGLVGTTRWGDGISNCSFRGIVAGNIDVGGLVGEMHGTTTMRCYAVADVSGSWDIGGLVGLNCCGDVINCYADGRVVGGDDVGGLIGCNYNISLVAVPRSPEILYCYSVSVVEGGYVGGLVGYKGTNGPFELGSGIVRHSYWDIETSGQTSSDGGMGLTTPEMQTAETFIEAGWDFVDETANGMEDIWSICEGTNYPRLVWQIPAGDFVCPDGITIEDFVFFIEHWRDDNCDLSNDYCQGTDLDFSGTVDEADLEILVDNWLADVE